MDASRTAPTWMLSTGDVANTDWLRLPSKLLLPCFTPPAAQHLGVVWQVTGEKQPLLEAAVRDGCTLTVFQLRQIHECIGLPLPGKKQGSGKNGVLNKQDFCLALIEKLFASEPQAAKDRMFEGLMGNTRQGASVRCAAAVIAAVRELGKEAERDFAYIHEVALNQEAVEKQAKRERADNIEDYERKTYTPSELKDLLPAGKGIFCNRNPLVKRYQVGYPGQVCL